VLSDVRIICFAASYLVAFALELTRLVFRSGVRGAVMLVFAGAGLLAHTVFLYNRAVSATGSPLSSKRDWCLLAAWLLAVVYLYLTYYHPKATFGLFVLPLVLGLVGVAVFVGESQPLARQPASKTWGIIHGTSILLAVVSILAGFAAGLMYFRQAWRLKHKLPPRRGLRLPSLEWLQQASSRAIVISMLTLGVGVLSGIMLNLINHQDRLSWRDPFIVSSLIMFGWLVLSAAVSTFYKPARAGRKVAYLMVLSFIFLVVASGVWLLVDTRHGHSSSEGRRPRGPRVEVLRRPVGFTESCCRQHASYSAGTCPPPVAATAAVCDGNASRSGSTDGAARAGADAVGRPSINAGYLLPVAAGGIE